MVTNPSNLKTAVKTAQYNLLGPHSCDHTNRPITITGGTYLLVHNEWEIEIRSR